MVQTLTDGLSNPSSITNDEEAVRNVFSSGKAVFATNWLYMENMANFNKKESQVTGQVKMSLMPVFASQAKAGLKSASVDGSSGFSVISTSPNQDAAWGFVQYLTSEPTQIKYSDNQLPIWATSYQGDTLKKLEAISPVNVITFRCSASSSHLRQCVRVCPITSKALKRYRSRCKKRLPRKDASTSAG